MKNKNYKNIESKNYIILEKWLDDKRELEITKGEYKTVNEALLKGEKFVEVKRLDTTFNTDNILFLIKENDE